MTALEPDRRSKQRATFERLYDTLRERICLLDYQPGQRLSEEQLAAEFGVSRTPLRRVLARLEDEGLVRSVQSVGTLVTDFDLDALAQTFQLRMELAELIGRVAPAPPGPETLARLGAVQADLDALAGAPDVRRFAQADRALMRVLVSLTENEPLREITERLYFQTTRIWIRAISETAIAEEVVHVSREVADIRAALEIGDVAAVGHIRRSHISMSFKRLAARRPA